MNEMRQPSDNYKRAKEPVTPLAGPYGHPIHPLLVTMPIGAWVSSAVFDMMGPMSEDEWAYAIGAKRLIDIGIVTAAGAGVFGLIDFLQIPRGSRAWYAGLAHMALNAAALGLYTVNSASRNELLRGRPAGPAVSWWQRGLSLTTLGSLVLSGWIGGSLAYRYGVRVADEEHQQATGFREEGMPPIGELLKF